MSNKTESSVGMTVEELTELIIEIREEFSVILTPIKPPTEDLNFTSLALWSSANIFEITDSHVIKRLDFLSILKFGFFVSRPKK